MMWTCIPTRKTLRCWPEDSTENSRVEVVTVPFVDLLIGATALEVGYSLLTVNARPFRMIPGLSVIQL